MSPREHWSQVPNKVDQQAPLGPESTAPRSLHLREGLVEREGVGALANFLVLQKLGNLWHRGKNHHEPPERIFSK